MMKILIFLLTTIFIQTSVFASNYDNLSAKASLKKLKEGNRHFQTMHLEHPDSTKKRRKEMLKGQHPFAVILSCSDSRVPPELIFDQGLGDLFEIRNAGNVLDDHIIGSIEYAVLHLGVKLIVVMGHQDCGAIKATVTDTKGSKYIESLKESIEPALCECSKDGITDYDEITKEHARLTVKKLLDEDKELAQYMKKNNVKIIPAYYHLDTGKVDFYE